MKQLKMLPVGKSEKFYSPLQGDIDFIRTGTIPDGSCFFHALLHACSLKYTKLDDYDKLLYVKKFRHNMAKNLTKKEWMNMKPVSSVLFQENLSKLVNQFYKFMENANMEYTRLKDKSPSLYSVLDAVDSNTRKAYEILVELVGLKDMEYILSKAQDRDGIKSIKKVIITYAEKVVTDKLKENDVRDDKRYRYYTQKFIQLITNIVNECQDNTFERYKSTLGDCKSYVDQYMIGYIANKLDYDIYFLDGDTRMPYMLGGCNDYRYRKSIIMLWIENKHYEVVGKVIQGTKQVMRVFEPDDSLIEMIYTYMYNRGKFATKYPQYIAYLPKNIRNRIHNAKFYDSDSSSEEDDNREDVNTEDDEEDGGGTKQG